MESKTLKFIEGLGSILDIAGESIKKAKFIEDDFEAINADWQAIEKDFETTFNAVKEKKISINL